MMARPKTRRTISAALRLQYPMDRRAWEHIMAQSAQGYTVSQIIIDALNRAAGCTPEMFTRAGLDHQSSLLADTIKADLEAQMVAVKEELLREFAALLIEQLRQRNIIADHHQDMIGTPSGDGGFVDSLISSLSGRIKRKED